MKYELKSYKTGELIGAAFNLYLNNFMVLFLIGFVTGLVALFGPGLQQFAIGMETSPIIKQYVMIYGMMLIKLAPDIIAAGLITLIVSRRYLDKKIDAGDLPGRLLRLFFPLLLMSVLKFLGIFGGGLLLFIPGIIFYTAWKFSESIIVIEKLGPIESMKRSWHLTKGSRLWIFGVSLLIMLINFVWLIASSQLSQLLVTKVLNTAPFIVRSLPQLIFNALYAPFNYCVFILMYFSVRIKNEGFEVEHLADTFSLDYEVID